MFREVARAKQRLSGEECVDILKQELRGVLSVLGDDGYPYGVPVNHFYCEEDGKIYFHSGRTGHKMDAIQNHDKASLCVCDQGTHRDGEWALHFRSVIVFGRVSVVEDREKVLDICRKLSLKFTSDTAYIEKEIAQAGARTACFVLTPEHITGKAVTES